MKRFIRQNIFLIDGIGALVSALILGIVLPYFEVGLPKATLVVLSLTALVFGIYSLGCFFFRKSGRAWLKVIIASNLLYCLATALIVGYFYGLLTGLAASYFLVEIMLILVLVCLELRILRQVSR